MEYTVGKHEIMNIFPLNLRQKKKKSEYLSGTHLLT